MSKNKDLSESEVAQKELNEARLDLIAAKKRIGLANAAMDKIIIAATETRPRALDIKAYQASQLKARG